MTGWSALLTSVLAVHLVVSVARVEHLLASDLWILFRGEAFRRRQDELSKTRSGARRLADPAQRWMLYEQFDGGRLPWLFLGIQSGRLMMWSARVTGVPRLLLRVLRGGWRWYTYAVGSAALAAGYVWLYPSKPQRDSWLLLAILSVLVIGSVVVAAGGVLASIRMGAFARYHHFGWPPAKPRDLALHELAFVVGSSIIAFVVASGLILVIGAEFGGFGSFGPSDSWWNQLWNSAFTALAGVIGQGFSDPQNGFGVVGLTLVAAVQISHVVILLGVTQKTWSR